MRRALPAPIAIVLLAPVVALLTASGVVQAGMMTNPNQSAAFVRMPARYATPGIDGVYYNPAGLTRLDDGWHFSLNNQFVFLDGEVESDYARLKGAPSAAFPADASTVLAPGLYAVYRYSKSAVSFGWNRIRGLSSTDYSRGLPVFEMVIADLVPALQTTYGVTGYSARMSFKETSAGFGYQLGISHEISPALSLFGGGRLVTVRRTYRGGLTDVLINPTTGYDGTYRRADAFASENAAAFTSRSQSYAGAADNVQTMIGAGFGNYTLAQVQTAGYITSSQRAQYEAALLDLGLTPAQIAALNMTQIHSHYASATAYYAGNAALMTGIRAIAGDRELDVTQSGTGFTPILGLNLALGANWNVGLKYELPTKLELENDTKTDQFGSFPDGAKVRSDLPGVLSAGVAYSGPGRLGVSTGVSYYFDRNADYGRVDSTGKALDNRDIIDSNYLEVAAGVEYKLNQRLLLSLGYLYGKTGVTDEYQGLLGYSLDSHTLGGGGQYLIARGVALNVGCGLVRYREDEKEYLRHQSVPAVLPYGSAANPPPAVTVTDRYSRSDLILAIGIDYTVWK